jgi:cyclophilin family peptidyl-prolyl cis-trans isomerase
MAVLMPMYDKDNFDKPNPIVFMDIRIGQKKAGRMTFELFADSCPKTAENFRKLCTGEMGAARFCKRQMHFKNTIFHRVIKGFMAQGGDFEKEDGTGGESTYGKTFADENFKHKHFGPGMLSMANAGPNTNGSQFFLTFKSTPHLNGKHVVFGRLKEGMSTLRTIENVSTGRMDKPIQEVAVINCGEFELERDEDGNVVKKEASSKKDKEEEKEEVDLETDTTKEEKEEEEMAKVDTSAMNPRQKKMFELRMRLNASRKANKREVAEETKRFKNKKSDTTRRRKQFMQNKEKWEQTLKEDGLEPEEAFMHETAESVGYRQQKKDSKNKASYGWDVFNQDAFYNAYEKRLQKVRNTEDTNFRDANSLQSFGMNAHEPSEADIDNMVSEMKETQERRKKFSRRRQHYDDQDIDSINERNARFNKKLKRAYDKYTVETKANLERGTAL